VLRWAAADTAAAWKACTKKLSAFSWIKGPARESGAFCLGRKLEVPAFATRSWDRMGEL
jgi:hypothetical protein